MQNPSDPLRLVFEVERHADPIRGTVADARGVVRTYVGWLALMSALDELRGASIKEEPGPASPSS